jgi:Tol biopolymer transport system component
MTDSPDKPPEKREGLAALHTYEPIPANKLFPMWEWFLKFGWIGALAVAGVVGYRFWKPEPVKPAVPVLHFAPVSELTSNKAFNISPAISRDGKLVAYASDRDGNGSLAIWLRPIGSDKPQRITSGEFNDNDPDFSPDSRLITYRSERDGGGIYVQSTGAGSSPKLAAKNGWKPKFSPDGKWIAFFRLSASDDVNVIGSGQVFIVSPEGGEPRQIQPSFAYARYPIWAPDSRHVLFTGANHDGVRDWWVSPIDGGAASRTHALEWMNRSLTSSGYPDQWSDDRIFFAGSEGSQSHVWDLPISISTLQVTGPPRRLTDGNDLEQQIAVAGGRLLFAGVHLSSEIWSLPLDANHVNVLGQLRQLTNNDATAQLPTLAADGSKMVYLSNRSGVRDIWVSDQNGKSDEAVTSFRTIGYRPLLSPDGKRLAYPTRENRRCVVKLLELIAPGRLTELKGCFSMWDWSSDGSSLLTFQSGLANEVDLTQISTGERKTVLSHPSANLFGARFSPDGKWIAFTASSPGSHGKVFVAPLRSPPPPEREWIAAGPESSGDPAWSPDGSVLYFRSKQDGYYCIWAQKLGSGKMPLGEPIGVLHPHSAALGLTFMKWADLGIAVSSDRLTLNLVKARGRLMTMAVPPHQKEEVTASPQSQ